MSSVKGAGDEDGNGGVVVYSDSDVRACVGLEVSTETYHDSPSCP